MKCLILTLPAHGHVNISLGLSNALSELGVQVHAYTSTAFKMSYEANNAIVHCWPLDLAELSTASNKYIRLAGKLMEYSARTYPNLKELNNSEKYDFLIVDFLCVWGKALAIEMNIPCVHISPTIIMDRSVIGLNTREILSHLQRPGLSLIYFIQFLKQAKRFENISGTKWKGWDSLYEVRPSTLSLLFIFKEIQPNFDLLKDKHHFLGPSILGRSENKNLPNQWLNEGPLILVSLGTIFNNRPDFFKKCAQAVIDKPCQMVISKGKEIDQIMANLPSNVCSLPVIPQLFLLQRTRVFITHGGSNSIMEAIYFQVPMIVVPESGDHFWMANLIEKLEIGIWLKKTKSSTPQELWLLTQEVSKNPSYRKNLKKLNQGFSELRGAKLGAHKIQEWAKRGFDLNH